MTTGNTFVQSFTHLKGRPKADHALPLLQRIASLVKPIMRKHGWVLPVLSEFFPESANLVGLNVNAGQKILLRLRPAWAPDTFYDEEDIVRVMLHELTHNVNGPHDEKFYKFLSGLEDEYEALRSSGYAGEGFHSNGHRVGQGVSHDLPPHIARAKALEAAEKRRRMSALMSGGGRRLGGPLTNNNRSPRELAAEAAERRLRDEKACGVGQTAQREAEKAARESVEDRVIDLTGDDEPGLVIMEPSSSKSQIRVSVHEHHDHDCAEVPHHHQKRRSPSAVGKRNPSRRPQKKSHTPPPSPAVYANPGHLPSRPLDGDGPWSCPRCTLLNGALALQCAACMLMRPDSYDPANGWTCQICGDAGIPHQFWSCRQCGTIKANSVLG